MKKYITAFILILITSGVYSQVIISLVFGDKLNSPGVEFGLECGYSWSTISKLESNRRLSTFDLGFYFDIRMKNHLYLNTGLLIKSKMGAAKLTENDLIFLETNTYEEDGDYNQVLNYFILPVLARYRFKNHLYVEGGAQAGYAHKSYVEFKSHDKERTIRIRDFNEGMIKRFDVGLAAGAGYTLRKGDGITLGIKYYYGFLNVYKDKSGSNNSSLFIKLNVPVGGVEKE